MQQVPRTKPRSAQPISQSPSNSEPLFSKLKRHKPSKFAVFYFLICVLVCATILTYFQTYRGRLDECGYTVVDASKAVQSFAKTYGYKPGEHVDNLWPRLFLFMDKEYKEHRLAHKPARVCPETGQDYECADVIPQPGAPVILCKFPPHRASIKIIH